MTIRQAALLFFIAGSPILVAEDSLYDELDFLKQSSKSVDVNLPGENEITSKAPKSEWLSDSISTGQAGILKKPASKPEAIDLEEFDAVQKDKKKLRYRSR